MYAHLLWPSVYTALAIHTYYGYEEWLIDPCYFSPVILEDAVDHAVVCRKSLVYLLLDNVSYLVLPSDMNGFVFPGAAHVCLVSFTYS